VSCMFTTGVGVLAKVGGCWGWRLVVQGSERRPRVKRWVVRGSSEGGSSGTGSGFNGQKWKVEQQVDAVRRGNIVAGAWVWGNGGDGFRGLDVNSNAVLFAEKSVGQLFLRSAHTDV
jgi:hypothetical protein